MRIACLQFAPQVGDVDNNLNRADAVLSRANPDNLDLLVLPELAFSGYNFKSLSDISPFLEPTGAGITSLWARTTALKYNCVVAAGYPEKVDVSRNWPTSPEYYNSVIIVNQEGETCANYRKSHLYYTDETWALEGDSGFYKGHLPGIGRVAMGICMDINPYRFEAPWSAYEFAFHILNVAANVVVVSMAWLTTEDVRHFSRTPKEPDMETLTYWVKRLEPLIRAENDDEIMVVFANRTGIEEEAVYAGTSAVVGIRHGEVSVYGLLGRGEKELLVVDTSLPPFAKLVYRPEDEANAIEEISDIASAPQPILELPTEAGWPAPSVISVSSNSSGSHKSKSQTSSAAGFVAKESSRRIFGGHVFITQDALMPNTGMFPTTPFEESPVSPRYFWMPPELKTPDLAATISSTSHSLDERSGPDTLPNRNKSVRDVENSSKVFKPRNDVNYLESKELVETLRKVNGTQTNEVIRPVRRPSSPKSRNASRSGRGERSDSILGQRPPSVFDQPHGPVSENEILFRTESPNSRNACRTRSRTRITDTPVWAAEQSRQRSRSRSHNQHPITLDYDQKSPSRSHNRQTFGKPVLSEPRPQQEQYPAISPGMEKIDDDMLVFEEGERRPRRDSLECHADEDDFVVFHASMRRDRHGVSNSTVEKATEHPVAGKSTSKHVSPPGFSLPRPQRDPWITDQSQTSSGLLDSRAVSRGRQPTTKWSQLEASPTPSNMRSSPLSITTESRKASHVSVPTSPFSRIKSCESAKSTSRGSKGRGSQPRRGISTQSKATTGNPSLSTSSNMYTSRCASQESFSHSPGVYATSIRTFETISAPTTPDSNPPTPKAMVLKPDWDQITRAQVVDAGLAHVKVIGSVVGRPKSVVW